MKVIDYLVRNQFSNKPAIFYNDTIYTYCALYDRARQICRLIKTICDKRCNVAILLPNTPEYCFGYYATLLSGNIIAPIYYGSSEDEIVNAVNLFDICIIITDAFNIRNLEKNQLQINDKLYCIDVSSLTCKTINNHKETPVSKADDDISFLIGTSGSTSVPKRVMLSDRNIVENATSIISELGYTENDIFMIILTAAFSSVNTSQLVVALMLSASIVIYSGVLHPSPILSYINKFQVTTTLIVPSLLHVLSNYEIQKHEYPYSLKSICCGGAMVNINDIARVGNKLCGVDIVNIYGLTEASPRLCCNRHSKLMPYTVGKAMQKVKIKILNDSFEEQPVNTYGQIAARGPNIMRGYYNNPIETKKVIRDGWLLTGDIGKLDSEGYLYIAGRLKNIIIYNGINIYPEEIEDVLIMNPCISDVIVTRRTDSIYGEVPVAYVVKNGTIDVEQIIDFCKKHLPNHKIPADIIFVNSLNKTASGKNKRS